MNKKYNVINHSNPRGNYSSLDLNNSYTFMEAISIVNKLRNNSGSSTFIWTNQNE